MRLRTLGIASALIGLFLLAVPVSAGNREVAGKFNGREVFRLCIFFGHPPFPSTVVMSTPSGEVICTTEIVFSNLGAGFSCTLPGSRRLSMVIRRGQSGRVTWTATIGGRTLEGNFGNVP